MIFCVVSLLDTFRQHCLSLLEKVCEICVKRLIESDVPVNERAIRVWEALYMFFNFASFKTSKKESKRKNYFKITRVKIDYNKISNLYETLLCVCTHTQRFQ